jgi:hypothetical protein
LEHKIKEKHKEFERDEEHKENHGEFERDKEHEEKEKHKRIGVSITENEHDDSEEDHEEEEVHMTTQPPLTNTPIENPPYVPPPTLPPTLGAPTTNAPIPIVIVIRNEPYVTTAPPSNPVVPVETTQAPKPWDIPIDPIQWDISQAKNSLPKSYIVIAVIIGLVILFAAINAG